MSQGGSGYPMGGSNGNFSPTGNPGSFAAFGGSNGNFNPGGGFPPMGGSNGNFIPGTSQGAGLNPDGSPKMFDPNNPGGSGNFDPMGGYQQQQQLPQYLGSNPTLQSQIANGQLSASQIMDANAGFMQGQQNQQNFQQGMQPGQPAPNTSPYAKTGSPPGYQPGPNGTQQFTPPAYPTWLYGPTAGAFGGVTPPPGTPNNFGYFPGTQTWGLQPSGNNFR